MKKKQLRSQWNKVIILGSSLIILIILGAILYQRLPFSSRNEDVPTVSTNQTSSDLKYLSSKEFSFKELSDFFQRTAQEKGAEYAFEILRQASLQPDVDMHLLGHVIGDELYKQKGIEGINICTQEFRNACSHTIVIGLFQDEGTGALSKIAETCRNAPGGKGAYTMCFHGLGHGILAYTGYDMEKTSELCEMTNTEEYRNQEEIECMGGAVMEIIGGGGHDKELWEERRTEYLKVDEPLGLCTSDVIKDEARTLCVVYMTPFLFEATGGNIGNKNDDDIKKAFDTCQTLTGEYEYLRNLCYGSFGKEFPSIANNLDTRQLWKISDEGLEKVYSWCKLSGDQQGGEHCIRNAVQSLFWGGENEISGAVRFCNSIPGGADQTACFQELIGAGDYYLKPTDPKREEICETVNSRERESCRRQLMK